MEPVSNQSFTKSDKGNGSPRDADEFYGDVQNQPSQSMRRTYDYQEKYVDEYKQPQNKIQKPMYAQPKEKYTQEKRRIMSHTNQHNQHY